MALLNGIVQVALASADPPRLVAWYRDVLGIPVAFSGDGMTFFQTGGVRFMIGPTQPGQTVGGDTILYFEPENWNETNETFQKRGVAFVGPPTPVQQKDGHVLMVRAFVDPEGHRLALLGWYKA